MKKAVLILVAVGVLSCGMAVAEGLPIMYYPTGGVAFGNDGYLGYQAGIEVDFQIPLVSNWLIMGIAPSALMSASADQSQVFTMSVGLNMKFFPFGGDRFPLYLKGSVKNVGLTITNSSQTLSSYLSYTAGLALGYQWQIGKNFFVDLNCGAQLNQDMKLQLPVVAIGFGF